ncbi:MAG TPA: RNA 2',3'-cyclic phosphodiesterase [Candidatus Limnocylindrales bacterium]
MPGRRLFIATPLPSPVADSVSRLVHGVRDDVAATLASGGRNGEGEREVRWVRMDGLHLTLRFLGPTLDDRLPALGEIVTRAAGAAGPFEVEIAGGGAFPDRARPRVLWLGISRGLEQLASLASGVEDLLVDAGWPREERGFRAHLTVARADGVHAGAVTADALVAAAGRFREAWTVDRVVLFESHTGHGPARYEQLSEARLGG